MGKAQEPPTEYITQEDDMYFYVTEYDGDDLDIEVQHECIIEKLGYTMVFHAATLDMRLSHGAFRLYVLYHYWAHQKGRAWPSLTTVAKHLGASRSSIVAYNKELEDAGYIYRRARKNDSGHRLSSLVIIRSIKGNEGLTKLAARIFVQERGLEFTGDGGQSTNQGGQQAELSGQPVGQEELTIEEVPTEGNSASSTPLRKRKEYSKPYSISSYYKDKSAVAVIGTVKNGPWNMTCPACLDSVIIQKLNVPHECLCGMHEFTLDSKKSKASSRKRKPESVEAYYAIVKSRGVRYGGNEEYETDIATAVTDLPFWRQVVKEYIHPAFGGNPHGVDKMLVYYNEKRLPGTRKKKESEDIAPKFKTVEEAEAERHEPAVVDDYMPPGFRKPPDMEGWHQELEKQRKEE